MTYKNHDIEPGMRRLMDAHPLLFCGKDAAIPSLVSAGWYDLIDKLCSDIEAAIGTEACADFKVMQIKEKFGTLRFYYRLGQKEDLHIDINARAGMQHLVLQPAKAAEEANAVAARVRELVADACAASETFCETCGAPAQLRNIAGYIQALCEPHHAARAAAARGRRGGS